VAGNTRPRVAGCVWAVVALSQSGTAGRVGSRARFASDDRWLSCFYDPTTGSFLTRDPITPVTDYHRRTNPNHPEETP
jgi:hypothetical protein